jgi:hypothetical protein
LWVFNTSEDTSVSCPSTSNAAGDDAWPQPLGPDSLTWRYFGDWRGMLQGPWAGSMQNMHPQLGAAVEEPSLTAARGRQASRVGVGVRVFEAGLVRMRMGVLGPIDVGVRMLVFDVAVLVCGVVVRVRQLAVTVFVGVRCLVAVVLA